EWDIRTHEFTASKEWRILLGINPFELPVKLNIFDLIHPDDISAIRKSFSKNFLDIRRLSMHELRVLKPGGDEMYVLVSYNIIRNENKSDRKLSGVIVNIDNIKKHEHALWQLSEELMRTNKE